MPEINPRAAEPPYRQIAAWLRGRIEAHEFRPGLDPLPSEKELWPMATPGSPAARALTDSGEYGVPVDFYCRWS